MSDGTLRLIKAGKVFGFEKLELWQLAVEFADLVYRQTQCFPDDEKFGLTSQLRRSAVSISANIAEGSGRGSKQDFQRFLAIAYGSLMETVSHIKIASRRNYIDEDSHDKLYLMTERIAKMLSGLRSSLDR